MHSTTLILIRHGHVVDNDRGSSARLCGWTDPPLSARGEVESLALARRLIDEGRATALYTSPLQRARATATIVGAALGLRPRERAGWREISCGWLDGWLLSKVQA